MALHVVVMMCAEKVIVSNLICLGTKMEKIITCKQTDRQSDVSDI